jgi:two-component system CheB/CheR fusion protein
MHTEPKVAILLVDDQPANLLALEAVLSDPGHDLVRATSGTEALDRLLKKDFAVILLDVQMTGLDGFETARLLRTRERSRHTPIIFLTAHSDDRLTAEQAYTLGAVDYLHKPVPPVILRAKVASFVELFRQARQLERQAEQLRQAQEERAERHTLAQYAVAGLLADSATLVEAVPKVLHTAGETLGWDVGALWSIDRDASVLRCVEMWRGPAAPTADFEAASRGQELRPGEGLPGRVWASGQPASIEDVAADINFPRALQAGKAGLRGACALPIRLGGEMLGVLEFFRRDAGAPDGDLLRVLAAIATQVGHFLERRNAEEDARKAERERALLLAREQETRALLDTLLRGAPVGLAFVDRQLRYVRANDALAAMDGRRPEDIVGKTMWEVVPALAPLLEPLYRLVLQTGEPVLDQEVSGETPAQPGRLRHWLCSYYPVRIAAGEVVGVGAVVAEITERKQLEEVLRQRAEELAEEGRRKDRFLATLGHELRNPLAPLRNCLHILADQPGDAETRELWDIMDRQLSQLTRLVDDLLDLSRVNRGLVQLRTEAVDLAGAVHRALETARPLLDERGHALELDLPVEPVLLEADPLRLEQIVVNLLTNAARYTPPVGRIRVAAGREGDGAVVRVRDSGIGIRPEMLKAIFEMFTHADRLPGRVQEGLGIGLTLVRYLTELHGGRAEAQSEGLGKGSEFIVRLPLKKREGAKGEQRGATEEFTVSSVVPRPSPLAPSSSSASPCRRVLVVDDNADVASSCALLLRLKGQEVRVAHDGSAALAVARDFRPQVVLLDIGMPGMDGYELARQLRLQPEMQGARLVALTGYGQGEDRKRSLEAGLDAHLVKPVAPEALDALLTK